MANESNMTAFNDGGNPYRDLLETFLKLPLGGTDEIFALFSSLPGAIFKEGKHPMERFVYIPGTRKDRVLLTAHADTVWDERYGVAPLEPIEPKCAISFYFSASYKHGIGADDRVGCAMLWGLRNCGHSILLTDGEEKGKIGARYLRKHHKKLYREINRTHRMILALDAPGSSCYLLNQVDYTSQFRDYIEDQLAITHGLMGGGSDLEILCGRICGANLGVGYINPHRNVEMFIIQGWNDLYRKLYDFLQKEHPRFPINKRSRFKHGLIRTFPLPARVYHKLRREGFKATAAAVWRRLKGKPRPKG
jgi:hypothetical protein